MITLANASAPSTSFAPFLRMAAESALLKRYSRRHKLSTDRARRIEMEICRLDIVHWITTWVDTYDPRFISDGCPATIPFSLYPRQIEFLEWLAEREKLQEDGSVEKSREVGATWLFCAFGVHSWLFRPGFRLGITSRGEEAVDKIGDMKSIFERMRFILRSLPRWMLPDGFDWRRHDNFRKLVNPATSATITGEVGDNVGRGDKTTMYIVDEAAYLTHADQVSVALSQTTRCRIDISTANGTSCPYYKKLRSLPARQVFRFGCDRHSAALGR